ncbi:TonB-dependent receptor [Aliifodinibius sp. S!AR15-10]|uniref:TonB-dependent receptor n=1 Tax=Aliifodinibius sp. S!AR15-10 TaxID=2950437 RepID=UPI00285C5F41|nr:TonB-dependent receptor [Aliifodinibius sp. S!AR15-10]MDR8391203.1 TonB-dependent receptor [Aliifodinibius sp. S!AR15-10]
MSDNFQLLLAVIWLGVSFLCASPLLAQKADGSLEGIVKNPQNKPVPDVHILLDKGRFNAVSDNNGEFTIEGIPPGKYSITTSTIGYEPLRRTLIIKPGITNDVTLTLSSTSYSSGSVVVTATRTKRDIEEVPIPVTLITTKEVENTGNTRLDDLLAEQTGLVPTSDHGNGIQLQGFDSDYTLIMLNGQPLIGRRAGTLDLSRISVGNIKQVEMIKGPSSALWGSDALAGVINIITEEGSRPLELNVYSRYGTNQSLDLGTNVSFRRNEWNNTLHLNHNSSEGYQLNPESISQTVPEYENYTLDYRTEWDISPTFTAQLQTRYYRELQHGTDYLGTVENPTFLNSRSLQEDYSVAPSLDMQPFSSFRVTLLFYSSRFHTDSRWRYRHDDNQYDREKFDQFYNNAEVQADYSWNADHVTTAGSGANWEKLHADRYEGNQQFSNYFAFAQHEWHFNEKLDLISGFRYDAHSEYASQLSPKLSARFKATDWLHLRGSMGGGFKAPDFRQLFLNFTNPTVGYSVFGSSTVAKEIRQLQEEGKIEQILTPLSELSEIRAERSWAYNAGFDIDPLPGLRLRANGFHNDVDDLIETAPIADKTNGQSVYSYFNLDEIFTQGIEANLQWNAIDPLTLSLGYQLLDARRKVSETRTVQDENGEIVQKEFVSHEPMFNRSRHSGTAKLFYELKKYDLEANIRGTLRGKYGRYDANGNGYVDADEYESGYTIWDAALAKTFAGRYRLQFGVDNILDYTRPGELSWLPGRLFYLQANIRID